MKSSYLKLKQLALSELIFMLLIGVFFGILGSVVERPFIGIVCGTLVIALFASFTLILKTNEGVWSGLFTGILIGIVAIVISRLIGGNTDSFVDSFLFGIVRGLLLGAIAGALTRVQSEENDSFLTKLFLFFGSIFLVALLGVGVGLIIGLILGLMTNSQWWWVITAVLGGTVGGYLISVKQKPLLTIIISLLSAVLTIVVIWQNGILAGIIIGLLSGAIAPMLLVAFIGAYGGLTARGPVAMVVESIEAPQEMLSQGAAPFLLPAMVLGLIIGTTTGGVLSLLILPTILGIFGIFLGAFDELERNPSKHISTQSFIDRIIIGTEKWPFQKTGSLLFQQQHRTQTLIGILVSLIIGIGGGYAGIFIINSVITFIHEGGFL